MRSSGTPRLSVITPLFNCLGRTQAMLSSLRASIPGSIRYEVILVDDASTDGTREWIAGLGEPCRVILNERNMGFGAATNRGAGHAPDYHLARDMFPVNLKVGHITGASVFADPRNASSTMSVTAATGSLLIVMLPPVSCARFRVHSTEALSGSYPAGVPTQT